MKEKPVKRRALYVAIAIVILGVALRLSYVLVSFPYLGNSKGPVAVQLTKVAPVPPTPAFNFKSETPEPPPCSDPVEDGRVGFFTVCTADDQIEYKGIRVERFYLNNDGTSTVMVKRGRQVLARHSEGQDRFGHDSSFFALFPLLGGTEKQLIISQFTGGAHCCFDYWIYELHPRFRLIFDGTKYGIGDGFDPVAFQDFDGDGIQEFTQKIITFDYWLDCYTCTPQPTMVFKYDRKRHKYLPASRGFVTYLLKGPREEIQELRVLMKAPEAARDWPLIERYSFDVLLSYIYAGKERQAWKLYERFAGGPGDSKWRRKIRRTLKADSLYRFLYPH